MDPYGRSVTPGRSFAGGLRSLILHLGTTAGSSRDLRRPAPDPLDDPHVPAPGRSLARTDRRAHGRRRHHGPTPSWGLRHRDERGIPEEEADGRARSGWNEIKKALHFSSLSLNSMTLCEKTSNGRTGPSDSHPMRFPEEELPQVSGVATLTGIGCSLSPVEGGNCEYNHKMARKTTISCRKNLSKASSTIRHRMKKQP